MKTQHTSGPWRTVVASAHEFNPNTRRRDIIGKCEFGDAYVAGDISEIDARLIAAAPDLLAILKKWSMKIDESCADSLVIERLMTIREAREINAVIAKAEGRAE